MDQELSLAECGQLWFAVETIFHLLDNTGFDKYDYSYHSVYFVINVTKCLFKEIHPYFNTTQWFVIFNNAEAVQWKGHVEYLLVYLFFLYWNRVVVCRFIDCRNDRNSRYGNVNVSESRILYLSVFNYKTVIKKWLRVLYKWPQYCNYPYDGFFATL